MPFDPNLPRRDFLKGVSTGVQPWFNVGYRLAGKPQAREWTFGNLPLADYPFLITDASLVASAVH